MRDKKQVKGVLSALAVIGIVSVAAYGTGRIVGGSVTRDPIVSASVLEVGDELPVAIVHVENNGPVDVRTLIDSEKDTILLVAQVNCASCIDEAERWDELFAEYGEKNRFIALLCANEFSAVKNFRDAASLQFENYLCERGLLETMARQTPAIYSVGPDGRILFSEFGFGSWAALEHYLDAKGVIE